MEVCVCVSRACACVRAGMCVCVCVCVYALEHRKGEDIQLQHLLRAVVPPRKRAY